MRSRRRSTVSVSDTSRMQKEQKLETEDPPPEPCSAASEVGWRRRRQCKTCAGVKEWTRTHSAAVVSVCSL